MIVKASVLICALGVSPAECNRDNALANINAPDALSMSGCMMQSQAYVANTVFRKWLEDGHKMKVICKKEK